MNTLNLDVNPAHSTARSQLFVLLPFHQLIYLKGGFGPTIDTSRKRIAQTITTAGLPWAEVEKAVDVMYAAGKFQHLTRVEVDQEMKKILYMARRESANYE